MSFRRFRRGVPSLRPKAFSDYSPDTSGDDLLGSSGPQLFGPTGGAPTPIVHRLSWLQDLEQRLYPDDASELRMLRGYGAREPHIAPALAQRGVHLGGTRVARPVRIPTPLLKARRRLASQSWRALNALRFALPRRERICINRRVRRNVLFATKVAGRGRRFSPGAGGRYYRSEFSSWGC